MKRIVAVLTLTLMLCSSGVASAAEYHGYTIVPLSINGRDITASDVPPIIMANRTLVPLALVAESLNADVAYDAATNFVVITSQGKTTLNNQIPDKVDSYYNGFPTVGVIVDGKIIYSEVPPINFHNRTLVPVAVVAKALGAQVSYINGKVIISSAISQLDNSDAVLNDLTSAINSLGIESSDELDDIDSLFS